MLRVLDLFSGIGGFSLGLERTGGFETVAFCEIEPFPRKVLAKHWPEVPIYEDVRTLTAERLAADGIAVDVITGGFPCQDVSTAGKRAGVGEGTRSGLYSEVIRLARDIRPKFIIMENVAGLLSGPSEQPGGWFGRVLGDLAECGYDAEWENIPASALGAPHRRERVWIVAYPNESGDRGSAGKLAEAPAGKGIEGHQSALQAECCGEDVADSDNQGLERRADAGNFGGVWPWCQQFAERCVDDDWGAWRTEPALGRVANGVPHRAHRIAGLGNAVVPQIPELIGNAILAATPSRSPLLAAGAGDPANLPAAADRQGGGLCVSSEEIAA